MTIRCGSQSYSKTTTPHKGSPKNPLTWADACEKFGRYTQRFVADAQARSIIDAVSDLDNTPDMARIAGLVAKR